MCVCLSGRECLQFRRQLLSHLRSESRAERSARGHVVDEGLPICVYQHLSLRIWETRRYMALPRNDGYPGPETSQRVSGPWLVRLANEIICYMRVRGIWTHTLPYV